MKNLQATTEGIWVEIVNVVLTEEQNILLRSHDESFKEDKITLLKYIRDNKEKLALTADINIVQAVYDKFKNTILATDKYQLISADLSIGNQNEVKGIINYRVNDNHLQLRY